MLLVWYEGWLYSAPIHLAVSAVATRTTKDFSSFILLFIEQRGMGWCPARWPQRRKEGREAEMKEASLSQVQTRRVTTKATDLSFAPADRRPCGPSGGAATVRVECWTIIGLAGRWHWMASRYSENSVYMEGRLTRPPRTNGELSWPSHFQKWHFSDGFLGWMISLLFA